jgi:hypothetical protein
LGKVGEYMRIKLKNKIIKVSKINYDYNRIYIICDTNDGLSTITIRIGELSQINKVIDELLIKGYCDLSHYEQV